MHILQLPCRTWIETTYIRAVYMYTAILDIVKSLCNAYAEQSYSTDLAMKGRLLAGMTQGHVRTAPLPT